MTETPFEGLKDIFIKFETHSNRLRIVAKKTAALAQSSVILLTFLRQYVNENAEGAEKLISDMDRVIENLPEEWNDMKDAMDAMIGDVLETLKYSEDTLNDMGKTLDELIEEEKK